MFFRKYKLIKDEFVKSPALATRLHEEKPVQMYRLQALRNIPEHDVKKGDLGGLVSGRNVLSHDDHCWIGYNAKVFGNVFVSDDAYIGDKATISCFSERCSINIRHNAKVYGEAFVYVKSKGTELSDIVHGYISGHAEVYGEAYLHNVERVWDYAQIHGEAWLEGCHSISGNSQVFGNATVKTDARISGDSKIYGNAVISEYARITDSIICGATVVELHQEISGQNSMLTGSVSEHHSKTMSMELIDQFARLGWSGDKQINPVSKQDAIPDSKTLLSMQLFEEVTAEISAYETDIVKIIQYPSMTDRAVPETRDMVVALKLAKRLIDDPASDDFNEAVADLEKKFLTAESVALKIADTKLSAPEKKKTAKAKDLLAVAENEASTDHEKKVAFQQAFKQLEGVIVVPEIAVETFRLKIGLKEILA
jgi:carbonic anhydrase/acetyltransferase-like protein (isoleucine patch superfamily)